jgi:hypothetical protein
MRHNLCRISGYVVTWSLSALFIIQPPANAADLATERQQAKAAMEILNRWHAENPEPGERYLHLVCWTPSDREFPENDQVRLTRIMEHIQAFYESEMARYGMPNRTIRLKYEKKQLLIHRVRGQHPTEHYKMESGSEIRKESLPVLKEAGIDADKETIFILCNLAEWDADKLSFKHKSPYYAGGSFRSGTAWQLDSPELDTRNLSKKQPMIQDGQYGRISLGKHNSIFIGGMAHELGHALGLPHCTARPDESVKGEALMGSGNRTYGDELRREGKGTFLTLAHALRLASHPQFSGSVKGLQDKATVELNELKIDNQEKAIHVSGIVKASPPVYAVVAYFDPAGGSDYDATTATAIPDEQGRFALSSNALRAGKKGELRLFPLHVNGSAAGQMSSSRFRYSYSVSADGTPDLMAIKIRQELQPVLAALAGDDQKRASTLADELQSARAIAIAKQLLNPGPVTETPAEYQGNEQVHALTAFKPTTAKVGWGKPTFNRVPDEQVLLECDGQIFESGIYAHAPSQFVYQLSGQWNRLQGHVGLAAGHEGSVVFEIVGDGRSLWKSKVVDTGDALEFDVALDGIQQLELLTHTTDDGASGDWGLWLAPLLKRGERK